jgi:LmbE family N-acetylglucosaminyl deacetylase
MMLDGPLPTVPEGNIVLVVMAHPDDAEFGCGGTIAKWAAGGSEVVMVLGTRGDKGTSDATKTHQEMMDTREAEQHEADAEADAETATRKVAGA